MPALGRIPSEVRGPLRPVPVNRPFRITREPSSKSPFVSTKELQFIDRSNGRSEHACVGAAERQSEGYPQHISHPFTISTARTGVPAIEIWPMHYQRGRSRWARQGMTRRMYWSKSGTVKPVSPCDGL